jgi:DNA-binding NtrC family response regulator
MILIIDDDSAIRSSLSFMLKRAKYDVQAVPGPKEAVEIVRSVAPQLILMDMNFTLSTSGEEGLTLLKQVKVFRPDVPVILCFQTFFHFLIRAFVFFGQLGNRFMEITLHFLLGDSAQ